MFVLFVVPRRSNVPSQWVQYWYHRMEPCFWPRVLSKVCTLWLCLDCPSRWPICSSLCAFSSSKWDLVNYTAKGVVYVYIIRAPTRFQLIQLEVCCLTLNYSVSCRKVNVCVLWVSPWKRSLVWFPHKANVLYPAKNPSSWVFFSCFLACVHRHLSSGSVENVNKNSRFLSSTP